MRSNMYFSAKPEQTGIAAGLRSDRISYKTGLAIVNKSGCLLSDRLFQNPNDAWSYIINKMGNDAVGNDTIRLTGAVQTIEVLTDCLEIPIL